MSQNDPCHKVRIYIITSIEKKCNECDEEARIQTPKKKKTTLARNRSIKIKMAFFVSSKPVIKSWSVWIELVR